MKNIEYDTLITLVRDITKLETFKRMFFLRFLPDVPEDEIGEYSVIFPYKYRSFVPKESWIHFDRNCKNGVVFKKDHFILSST